MNELKSKPRIEYVDLVKGFCMFFVVSFHCHVTYCPWLYDLVRCMYLPAFFFCAALFFNSDVPFRRFLVRKINLLLVPWAFFLLVCLAGYSVVYAIGRIVPASGISWQSVLGDYSPYGFIKFPANLPSWYLWCIFFSFMAYYAVSRLGRHILLRGLLVVASALAGWYFEQYDVRVSLRGNIVMMFLYDFHFFTALEMLPFMFAGEELRRRGLLEFRFRSLWGVAVIMISSAVWAIYSGKVFVTLYGHVWPLEAYLPGFAGTASVFAIMAVIRRFPLLHFLGRYSLTVLCTHYMLFLALENFISNPWLLFVCVLVATLAAVKLFVTYCPSFTGQRNLIPLPTSCRQTSPEKDYGRIA
ncbi:MAG: acyltransferase [Muribaculaceae bacterium]|nr:acyltransferase [Muribaculaceae bacterium]MDE6332244.1 acyltransferase [Muribaculaceae bacterium]